MDKPAPPPSGITLQPLKDPVCGMTVNELAEHQQHHGGTVYYFCSAGCKTKFNANPAQYTNGVTPVAQHAPALKSAGATLNKAGTVYTCPMHPEIRQDHPGDCPICGMALEALMPDLEEGENKELIDFQHRFWWTLPFTVIVTTLAMVGHRLTLFEMGIQSWIEFTLSLPVVIWASWPFLSEVGSRSSTAAPICGR